MLRIQNARHAIIICALGALSESLFYTALAPLLPSLDRQLGLGHAMAGILVAGYAIGYIFGTYPAIRLVTLRGPRATAVIGVMCVAFATAIFAVGDQLEILIAARILVGFGSVIAYTGVIAAASSIAGDQNRGLAIGTVYSGSAAGAAVGPLVGAAAEAAGRGPIFGIVAIGQLAVAGLLTQLPHVPAAKPVNVRETYRYLRYRRVWVGVWVTSIPGFALGVLVLSGSYRLSEIGATSLAIALAFSGIAVINVVANPTIGRLSDRIGRQMPILLALISAAVAVILMTLAALEVPTIILIALTGALLMTIGGPGLALIGDEITAHGGSTIQATLLMNTAWGPSAALGAILAGLFHGAVGAELSFAVLAAVALGSAFAVHRFAR